MKTLISLFLTLYAGLAGAHEGHGALLGHIHGLETVGVLCAIMAILVLVRRHRKAASKATS